MFGSGLLIGVVAYTWRILDEPRRACKIYEQNNPDVIPFKKLKKVAYKTKPYEDEIEEPETGLNQKFNIALPQAVYAMIDENENVIYQAYFDTTVSYNTQIREAKFSLNSSLAKKHSKYYISSFLLWKGMFTRDLYNWSNKILKEEKSKRKGKKQR